MKTALTPNDPHIINMTGQQMLDLGWDIGNDSPEDQYELYIRTNIEEITASILCFNNEYSDSGFNFDFADTFNDLRFAGYFKTIVQELSEAGEWFNAEKFKNIDKYSS